MVINLFPKSFTFESATRIVPVLLAVTSRHRACVDRLMVQIDATTSDEVIDSLEKRINAEIMRWQQSVEKLGGSPKGLWLVDLPVDHRVFCWKFPETSISHYHLATEGFSKRRAIKGVKTRGA